MDIKLTLIAGLIIMSIGLCYTIAQLYHRLRFSNKENDNLVEKNFKSEDNFRKEISNLKNEISNLNEKHKRSPKKGRMINPGKRLDDI